MEQKDLSRALRAEFWPRLRQLGFEARTERAAWRYEDGAVDVIDFQTVGSNADACGCTAVSFGAFAGSVPSFMPELDNWAFKDGLARPRYWDCRLKVELLKTLQQPIFAPFAKPPAQNVPEGFRIHREALMSVLRRDIHDRPDIWFVQDDGSNLDEVMADLWRVTNEVGLPMLERLHDPCQTIELVLGRKLGVNPDSSVGREILHAARRVCPGPTK